jgi:hypothetical protein
MGTAHQVQALHTLHKLLILAPHVEQLTQQKPKWKKLEASKDDMDGTGLNICRLQRVKQSIDFEVKYAVSSHMSLI